MKKFLALLSSFLSSCLFVFQVSQRHTYISFQLCMKQCHDCTKQQLFIRPLPSCFEFPAWDTAESQMLRDSMGVMVLTSCPQPANVTTSFTTPPPHHRWPAAQRALCPAFSSLVPVGTRWCPLGAGRTSYGWGLTLRKSFPL